MYLHIDRYELNVVNLVIINQLFSAVVGHVAGNGDNSRNDLTCPCLRKRSISTSTLELSAPITFLSQEARKFQREFSDEITPLSNEIHWPFAPKLKFESSLKERSIRPSTSINCIRTRIRIRTA